MNKLLNIGYCSSKVTKLLNRISYSCALVVALPLGSGIVGYCSE